MNGITAIKTAAAEELPDADWVVEPFLVARLAGDALGKLPCRIQAAVARPPRAERRTRSTRPGVHCTGADVLIDRRASRFEALFAYDEDAALVEATWGIYRRMIAAYRHLERPMAGLIESKSVTVSRPR